VISFLHLLGAFGTVVDGKNCPRNEVSEVNEGSFMTFRKKHGHQTYKNDLVLTISLVLKAASLQL
jgi:hypothetical protein